MTPSPVQYTDENGNPVVLKSQTKYTDENGNPIQLKNQINYPKTEGGKEIINYPPQIPPAWYEQGGAGIPPVFTEKFDPTSLIPIAGSLIPGGRIPSAIGGGLGQLVRGAMQRPGGLPNQEDVASAGATALLGMIMPGGETQEHGVKRAILNKLLPIRRSAADLEGLAMYPELNPTVGQATGNKVAQGAERIFASSAKEGIEQRQQQTAKDLLTKELRPRIAGGTATPEGYFELSIPGKAKQLRQIESQAWDRARQNAIDNTQTFINQTPGGPVSKTVAGPINTQSATQFAQEIKPDIDNLLKNAPDLVRAKYFKLSNVINKLTDGSEFISDSGEHINSFDTIKALRTDINELVNKQKRSNVYTDRVGGALSRISSALNDDITDSMGNWQGGENALQAWKSAGYATGNRVRAVAFDKLLKQSTDTGSGTLNPDKFLQTMEDESKPYYNTFTASDRSDITNFMRAVRSVSPDASNYGRYSLMIHGGNLLFPAMLGHTGAAIGVGTEIAGHTFARTVLLNPRYARLAAKLPSLPTDSVEANTISKTLFKAMKGEAVSLITPDGGKVQGHIDEKGQVKPDFQLGQ